MARNNLNLSKSRIISGLQCPLRLWHQTYHPELASPTPPSQQSVFDIGQEVGGLATRLYPGGVLIEADYRHHEEAVQTTGEFLHNPSVPALFEAGFRYDGVRVRADILERTGRLGWNLIEVKSSNSLKDYYLWDLGIQYYVLSNSGVEISRAGILHLNRDYLYPGGELDLRSLFTFSDQTIKIGSLQEAIMGKIWEFKELLSGGEPPRVNPSRACFKPHDCEFWDHCTREKPDHWILNLSGITQRRLNELEVLHIQDIREIPEAFPLTGIQKRVWNCVINQREYIGSSLKRELEDLEYPIHFLDFETFSPAIPRFPNTRPYQTIPFQWSDHILGSDGALTHHAFLHEAENDPREPFAQSLLDTLGEAGSIAIYTNYEVGIIKSLAEVLPQYRGLLLATLERMKDLYAVIKAHYYHPGFGGSFSLKSVLPALIPEMDYRNLPIQEGNEASLMYLKMLDPTLSPEEKETIKKNLLTYCSHDTLALVRIREELLKH
jgi:hypothetical protein